MPQWVASKPEGLREDPNLQNGIYVGPRFTKLDLACSLKPEEEDIIVGECSEEPTRAFIDDAKGEVYIPVGGNAAASAGERVLKLGKEDGIKNYFGFWDRLGKWGDTDENGWAEFKYVMCGADCVEPEKLADFGPYYYDDLSAYVLSLLQNENQKEIDWKRHRDLIVKSASRCLNDNEASEKACAEPARLALLKLANHPALSPKERLDLAKIMGGSFPDQARQILSKLTTNEQVDVNVRFSAVKLLNAWDHSLENNLNILALAVDGETPDSLRYDAAVYVYENFRYGTGDPRLMAINALLGLANDSQVGPWVRYQAADYASLHTWGPFQTREEEIRDEAIAVMLQLAGDEKSPADLRLDAAGAVFRNLDAKREAKDSARRMLLNLGRDKKLAPQIRVSAAEALINHDSHNVGEETATLFLSLATDPAISAENRLLAAERAYVYEPKRAEALKTIFDFANDRRNTSKLRFDAVFFAWNAFKQGGEESQKREVWEILVTLANDAEVTVEVRFNAATWAHQWALDAAGKEEALKAMEGLAQIGQKAPGFCMDAALFVYNQISDTLRKKTLLEKILECSKEEGAFFVFFKAPDVDLQNKTAAVIAAFEEDRFDRIINYLRNQEFSIIPLEEKISRAQMIFGHLRWFNWGRKATVEEALEFFEKQKRIPPKGKLTLKISQ